LEAFLVSELIAHVITGISNVPDR